MKVLIVLTSHDTLGSTGKQTGFWLEELAAPYYVFKDAGAEIVLASPQGGQPPLDPKAMNLRFKPMIPTVSQQMYKPKLYLQQPCAWIAWIKLILMLCFIPVATARFGI